MVATHQISHSSILLITTLLSMVMLYHHPATVAGQSMAGMAPMTAGMSPMTAAAPGPSGISDCMTALVNMSDCLSYVTPGSNLTVPDKPCCPELAGLVEANPICLCSLLGSNSSASSSLGIDIDVKRALKLPSVCKVQTPPVSLCSMIGVPVAGIPSAAPANSPLAGASPTSSMGSDPTSSTKGAAAVHHTVIGQMLVSLFLTSAALFCLTF